MGFRKELPHVFGPPYIRRHRITHDTIDANVLVFPNHAVVPDSRPAVCPLPGETYVAGCRNIQKNKAADRGSHRGFEEGKEGFDCQSTRRSLSDSACGVSCRVRAESRPMAFRRTFTRVRQFTPGNHRFPGDFRSVVKPPSGSPALPPPGDSASGNVQLSAKFCETSYPQRSRIVKDTQNAIFALFSG